MTSEGSALTVVVPVWGAAYVSTLPRAIASVRAQDERASIVVVDNASDVEVPETEGVVVVRAPRRLSAGGARNLGLEQVVTEYVVVLDADDELAKGALSALRDGIRSDPGIAVYAMSVLEAETGERHRMPRRIAPALAAAPRLFALATALWSLYPIQGNAILRSQSVRDAGGYPDCDWGDDWVLAVSQAFRGRVVIDPRPARIYHAHPESLRRRSGGMSYSLAAARQVRARLRSDPAVPRWGSAAVPLIALAHTFLIVAVRPVYRTIRRLLGRPG